MSSLSNTHTLSLMHMQAEWEENEPKWIVHAKSHQSDEVCLQGNKVFMAAAAEPLGSLLSCFTNMFHKVPMRCHFKCWNKFLFRPCKHLPPKTHTSPAPMAPYESLNSFVLCSCFVVLCWLHFQLNATIWFFLTTKHRHVLCFFCLLLAWIVFQCTMQQHS